MTMMFMNENEKNDLKQIIMRVVTKLEDKEKLGLFQKAFG